MEMGFMSGPPDGQTSRSSARLTEYSLDYNITPGVIKSFVPLKTG